jgi:hypothetical protein
MSRKIIPLAIAALMTIAAVEPATSQARPPVPADRAARVLPRQHLQGPRFGFTTFTGDLAKQRSAADMSNIMSQFGWQFETQIMSTNSGATALMEWVFLVGGVEQDELNIGVSWIAGFRTEDGLEFGVGPNIGVNKDGKSTTSMVVAAGTTMPFGEIYVPLNVAVAFAEGGPRITTLIGWIIG